MAYLQQRNGTWYIVFSDGRKNKIKRSLKTSDEAVARQMLQEHQRIESGHDAGEAFAQVIKETTQTALKRCKVSDLWKTYSEMPARRQCVQRTLKSKMQHVKSFVNWIQKQYPLLSHVDEVTSKHAVAYINEHLKGYAGRTKLNHLFSLSSVFDSLRIPYNLPLNVWDAVQRPEAVSIRKQSLSIEQISKLFDESKNFQNATVKDFWPAAIAIDYYTGLRRHDIFTLSWDEIDFSNKILRIAPEKNKREKKVLEFPLTDDCLAYFAPLYSGQKSGYVWPVITEAYYKNAKWLIKEFKYICDKAGIVTTRDPEAGEGKKTVCLVGIHSFRHSLVTRGIDQGWALSDLQHVVGHGSPVMTERYNHSRAIGARVVSSMPKLSELEKPNKD